MTFWFYNVECVHLHIIVYDIGSFNLTKLFISQSLKPLLVSIQPKSHSAMTNNFPVFHYYEWFFLHYATQQN